ncbi:MAG: hypothetical protein WCT04_12855 [Planctomycetota bacterium]
MRFGRGIVAGAGLALMVGLTSCGDGAQPAGNNAPAQPVVTVTSMTRPLTESPSSLGSVSAPKTPAVMTAVDYVIQAEECFGDNDRVNAIAAYDKAIALTEVGGNAVQAKIFTARKAAIVRGAKR